MWMQGGKLGGFGAGWVPFGTSQSHLAWVKKWFLLKKIQIYRSRIARKKGIDLPFSCPLMER